MLEDLDGEGAHSKLTLLSRFGLSMWSNDPNNGSILIAVGEFYKGNYCYVEDVHPTIQVEALNTEKLLHDHQCFMVKKW